MLRVRATLGIQRIYRILAIESTPVFGSSIHPSQSATLIHMASIIHFEYRRPGKCTTTYDELLVLDRPDVKIMLQENYSGNDVDIDDKRVLASGAPIVWYVFPDSWHDVGRFHLEDGSPTGWYTNLCQPVEFHNDTWIGNDLFLDLWQPVEGRALWLDEDEFGNAVKTGLLDNATRRRTLNERALIELRLEQGSWPPPVALDVDLDQVMNLLELG